MPDLTQFMTFPFSAYEVRELDPAVAEEPRRDGEGGVDCWLCSTADDQCDGSAHFHLWFYPRPYGRLQLRGTFLGMWSALLPDLPDDEIRAAGEQAARNLEAAA